jgi:hypothetical protein
LYGSDWPEENFPTVSSVRQSILRLSEKFSKLKKLPAGMAKNADIFDFLNTAYVLPGNAHSQRLKPFAHHQVQNLVLPVPLVKHCTKK